MIKFNATLLITIIIIVVVLIIVAFIVDTNKSSETPPEEVVFPDEIRGFSGTILAIDGQTLTIEASILQKDSTKLPIKQEMKVVIDNQTRISKLDFPTAEEMKNATKPIQPKETIIQFSDLKVGNKVNVQGKENIVDNIKNKTEFIAKSISVSE